MGNCSLLGDSSARSDARYHQYQSELQPSLEARISPCRSMVRDSSLAPVDLSQVRWNGSDRATTFDSGTSLTRDDTASRHRRRWHGQRHGFQPGRGRRYFKPGNFHASTIPCPMISSISPNSAIAGGAGFTLTVNGSRLHQWIRRSLERVRPTTTSGSGGSQRTATIPASDIASGWYGQRDSVQPGPGVALQTERPLRSITRPRRSPASALTLAIAGGAAFTLTVSWLEFRQWFRGSMERLETV